MVPSRCGMKKMLLVALTASSYWWSEGLPSKLTPALDWQIEVAFELASHSREHGKTFVHWFFQKGHKGSEDWGEAMGKADHEACCVEPLSSQTEQLLSIDDCTQQCYLHILTHASAVCLLVFMSTPCTPVHSKEKWFGQISGRSPCGQVVLFSSETSAHGLPGNYLYICNNICATVVVFGFATLWHLKFTKFLHVNGNNSQCGRWYEKIK